MNRIVSITNAEALKYLDSERMRRGDKQAGTTATKIVLERKREQEIRDERRAAAPTGP